ncbi:MAG: zinc ribbon domain-containing protein [Clostridia bacterium]|nr:zinc ribbon domain-containing protein [Clostridia bacterium]
MGFLERAIRRGVSDAVGKAIGKAIEPTVTDLTNKAANAIDQAAQNTEQQVARSSGLEGAMANLERSVQGYATEAAKNMKVCPNCNKPTTADKKFCPECGTKLPEQTVAQGAVCLNCGKQNAIGTKFCQDCGTKLPAAIAEEQAQADRNAAVMAEWDEKLPQYPKWNCGGQLRYIECYEENTYSIGVEFKNNPQAAQRAVEQYRQILLQNGFRQAGQYPIIEQLFKRIDGVVYNVDTEHCFEGDPDFATIGFCIREPYGGFDYVKPEPKKKTSFMDLFK